MSKIILELDGNEATQILKALALYTEYRKNTGVPFITQQLAKRLEELAVPTFGWEANSFEKCRYPVKKVTVTFYEENPKRKP